MKISLWAAIVAAGLLLTACGQDAQDSTAKAIIPTDPQSTLDLGKGLDTLSGQVKGDCVVRTEPEKVFASNGKSIRMTIEKIESSQDLFEKLDFTAEANYGVMVSGKAKYAKSIKVNDYSVYVMGKVNVQLMTEAMRDIQLKPDAYQLAGENFSRFLERCGNELVAGRTTGGELFIVLEIKTRSKEEKRTIEASIKGSYGLFGGSASFAQNLENIIKNSSTSYTLYQDGGVYTQANLSAEEVVKRITEFPENVNHDNGWPVSVTTVSYKTLALPVIDNTIDLAFRQEVLADYLKLSLAYEDYKNSLEFMLNNPSQFIGLDASVWNQKLIEVNQTLTTIARRSSDCYNLARSCSYNTDLLYPNKADLPQRIEKETVEGCMDSNARNYSRAANKAALCHYDMDAVVTFKTNLPFVAKKTLTQTFNFKTSGYTSNGVMSECMAKYRKSPLPNTIYKIENVTCKFRKYIVLDPRPVVIRPATVSPAHH
ncbi:hypothetical protein [Oligoflexus tunisiensis]|uniref:hypothetical protein n=1 Tax=Oligoflexus tunisiensis TaxID=708132 RepID=UPI00114C9A3B|nr:hypothetical protein [Oligoflexus tunisiensis]